MKIKKKIILFLVEGISDEEALSAILSDIIRDDVVSFQITSGDLTSRKGANNQNIIPSINKKVIEFMKIAKVKRSDISQIIHLIDIDGAYIQDEEFMEEDPSLGNGFLYTSNKIYSSKKSRIISRNQQKSNLMNKLSGLNEISGTSYKAYYFCCNLDHVFHNERNLDKDLKVSYAEEFQDRFFEKEKEFLKFIKESEFAVEGNFTETWNFIKQDLNSLGRYSNFHLFFNDFKDCICDEFLE